MCGYEIQLCIRHVIPGQFLEPREKLVMFLSSPVTLLASQRSWLNAKGSMKTVALLVSGTSLPPHAHTPLGECHWPHESFKKRCLHRFRFSGHRPERLGKEEGVLRGSGEYFHRPDERCLEVRRIQHAQQILVDVVHGAISG